MTTSSTNGVIQHLRRAVLVRDSDLSDAELLCGFIERQAEDALAALITRHGPMVWGVCRRLLNHHDAEDAFQATFIVLVRKAASIVPREMVGNWLYGVAHRTALQARRTITRRVAKEIQVTKLPDKEFAPRNQWEGNLQLDQELSRMPDIYRVVIVLCDLEGQTRKEVARQLGVPEGTVAGRLARARLMLAKRLTQRGVVLSGGTLVTLLSQEAAKSVPKWVMSTTINVATISAAGQEASAGAISAPVTALTEGVLKAMTVSKLKTATAVVLVVVALCGATIMISRTQAEELPIAKKAVDAKPDPLRGKKAAPDKERLQGKWKIIKVVIDGKETHDGTDEKDEMTINDATIRAKNRPTPGEDRIATTYSRFRLTENTNPKSIDVVEGEADDLFDMNEFDKRFDDPDERIKGIYSIEGDTLTMCLSPKKTQRPSSFESKAGSGCILLVFKRKERTGK